MNSSDFKINLHPGISGIKTSFGPIKPKTHIKP